MQQETVAVIIKHARNTGPGQAMAKSFSLELMAKEYVLAGKVGVILGKVAPGKVFWTSIAVGLWGGGDFRGGRLLR